MLSIIIPALNEEKNIELVEQELIPELQKTKKEWEIVFVDDGSQDNTHQNMQKYKQKYKDKITIIKHEGNKGLGVSLRDGITAAKGTLIIPLDADLTFHPREIHTLLQRWEQGDCDVIIGSHFSKEGRTENIPLHRLYLSKAVNVMYWVLLQQRIASVSSIFRLYKAQDLKEIPLEAKGFDINAEILFKLLQKKKRVVEVPVTLGSRRYGVSKINISRAALNHLKLFYKISKWRLNPPRTNA